jgi:hypothetical protein
MHLLAAIEERQLLGVNPQDKNNLADYLDYAVDFSFRHLTDLNESFESFFK